MKKKYMNIIPDEEFNRTRERLNGKYLGKYLVGLVLSENQEEMYWMVCEDESYVKNLIERNKIIIGMYNQI